MILLVLASCENVWDNVSTWPQAIVAIVSIIAIAAVLVTWIRQW